MKYLFSGSNTRLQTPSLKKISLFFLLAICCINSAARESGKSTRQQSFDLGWRFALGDSSVWRTPDFNDSNWRPIDLPHDWSIEGKINPQNPMGRDGGFFPSGIGWYRKRFKAPADWKGKAISLYFEGVYMNSEVFVNGKSLGMYPYGYSSFSYNITPCLNFSKENVISVRVNNSLQKNCRWYSGSGIYRHVWLRVTNPVHVDNWGMAISTPDVSPDEATVLVKTHIKNESASAQTILVSTELLDVNLKKVGADGVTVDIAAQSQTDVLQTIKINKPLLWTPETPHLYKAKVQLIKTKQTIDELHTDFGVRSIKFSSQDGFQLNGKSIKLNGGCVHHDNGCLGAAAFDRAEERKVELLKAAGFNAVRTSHNPPSEAFLTACDRLGIMVIDEAFDGWREEKNKHDYASIFNDWWKRDIEAMVLRDRNHPSIIMWSIGNEIIERKKPEAVETARMLAKAVHNIDSTRPVTSAMTTWDNDWAVFDPLMAAHDVCGYNYQLHRALDDHIRVPSRIIVQTESYPRDAFANWLLVRDNKYIIGDFVWTALDYLGESGIGRWYYTGDIPGEHWENDLFPWHGAYCGDLDLTGWRKPVSHYRNLLWNNTEKLYMAVREPSSGSLEIKETMWSVWPTWESWTWPGHEGKNLQVEVYSKYPKVALYLNDQFIGEQPTGIEQGFKATFNVPYGVGKLKTVGIEGNQVVESFMLQTSGEAANIKLSADRKSVLANGQDLSFVSIQLTDSNGVPQPNSTNRLHFKIEGPGVIAGVGNGDIKDVDPYIADTRKAWHGQALVVVRSTNKQGDIKLTVSSPGIPDAVLHIRATKSVTAVNE